MHATPPPIAGGPAPWPAAANPQAAGAKESAHWITLFGPIYPLLLCPAQARSLPSVGPGPASASGAANLPPPPPRADACRVPCMRIFPPPTHPASRVRTPLLPAHSHLVRHRPFICSTSAPLLPSVQVARPHSATHTHTPRTPHQQTHSTLHATHPMPPPSLPRLSLSCGIFLPHATASACEDVVWPRAPTAFPAPGHPFAILSLPGPSSAAA